MRMFWGAWMIGTVITIAIVVCFCYLLYLCVRALKKYLNEDGAAVKVDGKEGHRRTGMILAVAAAVLVGLSAALRGAAGASVSVIGGADGPTSVFVAGKVGSLAGVIGTVTMILNLVLFILMIYLLVLVIKALRKSLKGV